MLKHRLIFGTSMTVFFIALVLLDGWLDGSISKKVPDAPVQATLFAVFLAIVAVPANLELARLAKSAGAEVFLPITITSSVLAATFPYWAQFFADCKIASLLLLSLICLTLLATFLWQAIKYAATRAFVNCGANLLVFMYLGLLTSFAMAVRIDFGPVMFLMYVFVVKCADIGAYAIGTLFGKHKFSPVLSPKKTWEGMAGAIIFATVVSSIVALIFDIINILPAIVFGIVFAFLGQLGDLAESMLKRAAEQKDASNIVPGFGGILDVIDSPLATGIFAYLFFVLAR